MQSITVNPKFVKWAKGFSGMEGDLEGELWFCGIERGMARKQDNLDFKLDSKLTYEDDHGNKLECWNEKFEKKDTKHKSSQYNQKVSKVAFNYFNVKKSSYKEYREKSLFTWKGHTFKMNLYPLSFRNSKDTCWTKEPYKEHYKKTGFPDKQMYKAWCMEHRFPVLRNLIETYPPKVLICTGSKHKQDFILAFGLLDNLYYRRGKVAGHECDFYRINDGKTLVVITPFLGRGGIMSDDALIKLGKYVRNSR